ncbi:MAG TPA: SdpI family protein [Candidatus Paceibacterota bacterium]|nr:SdpI family protein [Candidatus Paceibacterota bacterium]
MILHRFPPKTINSMYGYRTKLSMLNIDTWNEANKYSSILLNKFGKFAIVLGIILCIFIRDILDIAILSFVVTIGISILLMVLTEKRLDTLFDGAGQRKVSNL